MDPEEAEKLLEAQYSQEQRMAMAKDHQALPDGSYPIKTKADLSNAIHAFGRAKDQGAVKAWIIKRAKALGAVDMLPPDWNVKESEPEPEPAPLAESLTLSDGALLESADNGQGWRWRVQIIQAGVSKNKTEYPLDVLHRAAPLYEGVPVFYGKQDHGAEERGFDAQAGVILSPKLNGKGIEGTFEIRPDKGNVREAILHGWQTYQQTGRLNFGFSHVIPNGGYRESERRVGGMRVRRIDAITQVASVDIVSRPSAGGELLGLVAAVDARQERSLRAMNELLERLRRGDALTEAELSQLREEAPDELRVAEAEGRAARAAARAEEHERKLEEAIRKGECRALLTEKLAEATTLPAPFKDGIRLDFGGRIFEAEELDSRIQRDTDIAAKLVATYPQTGRVVITEGQAEKFQKAMDGMIFGTPVDGVTPFRSIKQAYKVITGSPLDYLDLDLSRKILSEAPIGSANYGLLESMDTASFSFILGTSMTRRMLQVYAEPNLQTWRALVGPSNIFPVNDFKTQERMRVGGYGDLPTVAQGAPYQDLGDLSDEEATYSVSKRGGTVDLTFEAITNDDLRVFRRIPNELGIAAAATLYHYIFNTIIRDNATCTYDSVTLYHSSHANTGTTALSAAELLVVENAMRNQKRFGVTDRVLGAGNQPRFLVIPNELRDTAFRLTQSSVAVGAGTYSAEPNIFAGTGYQIIVVDDWTDPNNWYTFADPERVPFLEVGFLGGREDPEFFTQDMPNVGSTFTADKITYKVRHIWGVGILEHRGTYREVV